MKTQAEIQAFFEGQLSGVRQVHENALARLAFFPAATPIQQSSMYAIKVFLDALREETRAVIIQVAAENGVVLGVED